ncbi:transcription initiation factor TFIID subunit 4-like [Sciurus carolinensis]|uniref:transcription initiation factor TFIID subunit 4-like n=1 Tax=Sciurus carolinensis TaxID=30640 RepID=UPI001FB28733|nr:transcription initiation factor TFIID subunit 4-like [Sciurus carolinensis]
MVEVKALGDLHHLFNHRVSKSSSIKDGWQQAQGASAGPPPLPAGREPRRRGAAQSLRQLLPPRRAAVRVTLEPAPEPRGTGRTGARRKWPRSAPGVEGRWRASGLPPSHPAHKARSPRRALGARGGRPGPGWGLLRSGPGTARSPARRSFPRPPEAGPAQLRRDARPAGRGGTGGVTTLRAPRRLLRLLPGTQGFMSSGHGLSFLVPLLCPPSPSRLLGSFSPLPVAQSRAALFNNPPAPPACASRAALPEPPLPSQSCC